MDADSACFPMRQKLLDGVTGTYTLEKLPKEKQQVIEDWIAMLNANEEQ